MRFRRLATAAAPLLVAALMVPSAATPAAATAPVGQTSGTAGRMPAIHAVPDPAGGRFVDARGREVLLRGVNVNALVEYWRYGAFPTTFPLSRTDADLIAAEGWNVVRLAVSWSRIEPSPGVYDEQYLSQMARAVDLFASRGVYTLIDLHQDAWGPTLAARPGEVCPAGTDAAFGWDGAPGWATLDGGAARCPIMGIRETSAAVLAAFGAFWSDAPGPGGVGIRTRYAAMIGHVAGRFARESAVVGYDLMNEPNAFSSVQLTGLSALAGASLAEIRRNERRFGGFAHILFVEPSTVWPAPGFVPPDFPRDDQVAFAPHIYNGGLTSGGIPPQDFTRARADAARFGNAPVLAGEWGGDPRRADDPADGYFERHQALQDGSRLSATLWTWRESCGDPHKAGDARAGSVPYVWGEFEVDCTSNTVVGERSNLVAALRRGSVRAAPGHLVAQVFAPDTRVLAAIGADAGAGTTLEAFVPMPSSGVTVSVVGLTRVQVVAVAGGAAVRAVATGGFWGITAKPAA
jgi:endoglycosylceramidase